MFDLVASFFTDVVFDAIGNAVANLLGAIGDLAGNGVVASLVALLTFGRVTRTRPAEVAVLHDLVEAGEAVDLPSAAVKINGQRVARAGTPLRVAPGSVSIVARNSRRLELVPAGPIGAHPGRGLWSEHTMISFVSAAQDAIWLRVETALAPAVHAELTRVRDRKVLDQARRSRRVS